METSTKQICIITFGFYVISKDESKSLSTRMNAIEQMRILNSRFKH